MNLYEDLKWRGLLKDVSSPKIEELLNQGGVTFYIGTDPTGDSLHIGHFSSFLIASRLKKAGHHPILLIGGATGQIGDPKPTAERAMITKEAVAHNVEALTNQVKKIFGFEIVNNYDWSKDINFIDYLRDYGKYFSINYMLDKDIIRRRLETGITYAEFSYTLMQGYDFLHLYEKYNCIMQVEGSDQWGNITTGIDLIKKKLGKDAYGFTMPLILDKFGRKFGKSEGNALWLDKNKTSSYELYQYLINTDDEMIIHYLKVFTFLTKEEIEEIEKEHLASPEKRIAQQTLAKCIITDLHGEEEYEKALRLSQVLFSGDVSQLTGEEICQVFHGVPTFNIEENENILDFLVNHGIVASKREGREFITGGSISVNGNRVTNLDMVISKENAITNKYVIIRRGKKKYYLGIYS